MKIQDIYAKLTDENNFLYEYGDERLTKVMEDLLSIKDSGLSIELACSSDCEGFSYSGDYGYLYILSKDYAASILESLNIKSDFLVYIDTYEKEGCFNGEPDVAEGTLREFNSFDDAVKYASDIVHNLF